MLRHSPPQPINASPRRASRCHRVSNPRHDITVPGRGLPWPCLSSQRRYSAPPCHDRTQQYLDTASPCYTFAEHSAAFTSPCYALALPVHAYTMHCHSFTTQPRATAMLCYAQTLPYHCHAHQCTAPALRVRNIARPSDAPTLLLASTAFLIGACTTLNLAHTVHLAALPRRCNVLPERFRAVPVHARTRLCRTPHCLALTLSQITANHIPVLVELFPDKRALARVSPLTQAIKLPVIEPLPDGLHIVLGVRDHIKLDR